MVKAARLRPGLYHDRCALLRRLSPTWPVRLRGPAHPLKTADGSDRHSRRPATQGPYPHLRCQECGAHPAALRAAHRRAADLAQRSEEHTSELQSLMRISYAVFCLKKKKKATQKA